MVDSVKFVIYDDPSDDEIFERYGFWWYLSSGCDRADGPYTARDDAEESRDRELEWIAEEEEEEEEERRWLAETNDSVEP